MKFLKFLIAFWLFVFALHGFCPLAHATLSDLDRATRPITNILPNPGFENGKANVTVAGTGGTHADTALVTSGSNLLVGKTTLTWNSDGAAQTLSQCAAIPKGYYNQAGAAAYTIQTPSGTLTSTIKVTDGTNDISTVSNIVGTVLPQVNNVYFVYPSSGNVCLVLTSVAADEPLIAIDMGFMGLATDWNVSSVSQAILVGSSYWAATANCTPSRTNAALGALTTDSDCTGPTVEFNPGPGAIQTTDADAFKTTVNNLPAGYYRVTYSFTPTSSNTGIQSWAIGDGTTVSGAVGNNSNNSASLGQPVVGWFVYTNPGNRTFEIYCAAATGNCGVNGNHGVAQVKFEIIRYPTTQEQVYTPNTIANSWSGYHGTDCTWTRTNTAYGDYTADSTCTFTELDNQNFGTVTSALSGSDKLPGIVFTPSRIGRYFTCVSFKYGGGTVSADIGVSLVDSAGTIKNETWRSQLSGSGESTTLCGMMVATSVSAYTIKLQGKASSGAANMDTGGTTRTSWQIFQVDQVLPAPVAMAYSNHEFLATKSSGVLYFNTTSASPTTIVWPTATTDPQSMINTTTGAITIKKTCMWELHVDALSAPQDIETAGDEGACMLYVNGTLSGPPLDFWEADDPNAGKNLPCYGTRKLRLNVGDVVTIRSYVDDADTNINATWPGIFYGLCTGP